MLSNFVYVISYKVIFSSNFLRRSFQNCSEGLEQKMIVETELQQSHVSKGLTFCDTEVSFDKAERHLSKQLRRQIYYLNKINKNLLET